MVISETAECDKVKGHQLFLSIPIVPIFLNSYSTTLKCLVLLSITNQGPCFHKS